MSPGWHSLHLAHHTANCDDLLLDAVAPVLGRAEGGYFVRHWQRGPHVRLNTPAPLPPAALQTLQDHLSAHPSNAVLDQDALLPRHRRLAEAEQTTGPLVPFYPDNTVRVAPYDDRSATLGVAAELVRAALVATTPLAFDALAAVRGGLDRLAVGHDLIVATAHAWAEGGITGGFVSFRSHAEAFLAEGDRTALRHTWDREYRARAAGLGGRIAEVVATVEGARAVPVVRDWVAALRPVAERATDLLDVGALHLGAVRGTVDSDFHRALDGNDRWHAGVAGSTAFGRYRLLLNCAYLQLTRLGITPVQRFALCHLAANAVEERCGVRALDLVQP